MREIKENTNLYKVLKYLEENGCINTQKGMDDLGIFNVSAHIYRLKELGYNIRIEKQKNSKKKNYYLEENNPKNEEKQARTYYTINLIHRTKFNSITFAVYKNIFKTRRNAIMTAKKIKASKQDVISYTITKVETV